MEWSVLIACLELTSKLPSKILIFKQSHSYSIIHPDNLNSVSPLIFNFNFWNKEGKELMGIGAVISSQIVNK